MNEIQETLAQGLLTTESSDYLLSIKNEIQINLSKLKTTRTEVSIDVSVLKDTAFPDNASKYWQCLLEQVSRFDSLMALSFEYRRNELQTKRQKEIIKNLSSEKQNWFKLEEAEINLDECLYKKSGLNKRAEDIVEELEIWSRKQQLFNDGTFDCQDINQSQLESYGKTFAYELDAAMSSAGTTPGELLNAKGKLMTAQRIKKETNK